MRSGLVIVGGMVVAALFWPWLIIFVAFAAIVLITSALFNRGGRK